MSGDFDVLIVGSGAAGLTAALNLAESLKVAVISKGAIGESATNWAQGGIAAVLEEGDTFEDHVNDTMVAGAGLNDSASRSSIVIESAPAAIARLCDLGVPFATEGEALHLTREGGHSHRRIVHVADATGWAVQQRARGGSGKAANITLVPDMVRSTSSPAATRPTFRPRPGAGLYALDRRAARSKVESLTGRRRSSPAAGPAGSISSRPLRAARPETGSRWPGAPDAGCRTWNSCNSTRPASTISRSRTS
jgi:L-aspartate oxidase